MIHWILYQLLLTWREIVREVTIPHTLTGVLAYGIVHGLYAFIHREEVSLLKRLKTERHKLAWLHVKRRHNGRLSHCAECVTIQAHRLPEQPEA